MRKQRMNAILVPLAAVLLACGSVQAQTTWTWINTTDTANWSTVGNWDLGTVPNADGANVVLDNYANMHASTHGIFVDGADYVIGDLASIQTVRGLLIKSASGGRLIFQNTEEGVSTITVNPGVRGMTLIATVRLANDLNIISQGTHSGSPVAMTIGAVTHHTAGVKTITIDSASTSGVVQNQGNLTGAVRVEHNAPNAVLSMSEFNNTHTGGTAVNAGLMTVGNTALGSGKLELNGGNMRLDRNNATYTYFSGATEVNSNATINFFHADVTANLGSLAIVGDRTLTASGAAAGGNTLVFGTTTLAGNATFNVTSGSSNPNTLRLGAVSDGASDYNVTKTGSGILQLNAANTYSGNTTIAAGTLRLGASGTIANSPRISLGTVASQGTLDVTNKTAFTVGASQSLAGHGTLAAGAASVTVDGTLAPGTSTGVNTITVNLDGALALASTATLVIDAADGAVAKLEVGGGGSVTLDGTLKMRGQV